MSTPCSASAGQCAAAVVAPPHETTAWQLHTRIGRLRYLVYWLPYMFVCGVAVAALAVVAPGLRDHMPIYTWAFGGAAGCVLARRRLHDLGHSGWLAGLTLLPVITLVVHLWLLLAPGVPEPNRFGPPPSPNPRGAMAALWATTVVLALALMAAVIVPAVQAYNAMANNTYTPL